MNPKWLHLVGHNPIKVRVVWIKVFKMASIPDPIDTPIENIFSINNENVSNDSEQEIGGREHMEVDDDPHDDTTNPCSTASGDAQTSAQAAVTVRL